MPNHVHLILVPSEADLFVPLRAAATIADRLATTTFSPASSD
jgi:hypothetical protein